MIPIDDLVVQRALDAGCRPVAALVDPDHVPAVVARLDIGEVAPAERCAIVVGSEREGLSPAVLDACTDRVPIPLADGVDSLNVASATAIACHALRRQR